MAKRRMHLEEMRGGGLPYAVADAGTSGAGYVIASPTESWGAHTIPASNERELPPSREGRGGCTGAGN